MEANTSDKKPKPVSKPSSHAALRVRKETRRKVLAEVAKANRKDFGRKIPIDAFVSLAASLVTPQHIQALQEGSLSNADRFEREYRLYVSKHGAISKDEYLGKRLSGEIKTASSDAKTPENTA
jgi:hypothetical protein